MTAQAPDGQATPAGAVEDVLRVEHISKRFGAVTALVDLSLHRDAGRSSAFSATTARASPPCSRSSAAFSRRIPARSS